MFLGEDTLVYITSDDWRHHSFLYHVIFCLRVFPLDLNVWRDRSRFFPRECALSSIVLIGAFGRVSDDLEIGILLRFLFFLGLQVDACVCG